MENITVKKSGAEKVILEGFIPVEDFEKCFPKIKKSKMQELAYIILRSSPMYMYTRQPVKVKITVTVDKTERVEKIWNETTLQVSSKMLDRMNK